MPDTYSDNIAGEKLTFLFGDGATPTEHFTSSCSINSNSKLDLTSDIFTGSRANCTDPSKPSKTTRRVKGLDVKFAGSGMADGPSHKQLVYLWKTGTPFRGQAVQDMDDGYMIDGTWVVESIGVGGPHREDQAFDISLATAGDFDIVDT